MSCELYCFVHKLLVHVQLAIVPVGLSVQARTAPDVDHTCVASTVQYIHSLCHYISSFVCMQVLSKLRHIA